MAISSPYVQQQTEKPDPFEKGMKFGAQFGALMQKSQEILQTRRMDDIKVKGETFASIVKSTAGGLTEAAKQNETLLKSLLSDISNTNVNDPNVKKMYDDIASGQITMEDLQNKTAVREVQLRKSPGTDEGGTETNLGSATAPVEGGGSETQTSFGGGGKPSTQVEKPTYEAERGPAGPTKPTGPTQQPETFQTWKERHPDLLQQAARQAGGDPNRLNATLQDQYMKTREMVTGPGKIEAPPTGVTGDKVTGWKIRSLNRDVGNVNTENGNLYLTTNTETPYANQTEFLTGVAKTAGWGSSESDLKALTGQLWEANKVELMARPEFKGLSEEAARRKFTEIRRGRALESPEGKPRYVPPYMETGMKLKIPRPGDMKTSDVLKEAGASALTVGYAKKTEEKLDAINERLFGKGGYLSPEEFEREYPILEKEIGHLAKLFGSPTNPDGSKNPDFKKKYVAYIEHQSRLAKNLFPNGMEEALARTAPGKIELMTYTLNALVSDRNYEIAQKSLGLEKEKFKSDDEYRKAMLDLEMRKVTVMLENARVQGDGGGGGGVTEKLLLNFYEKTLASMKDAPKGYTIGDLYKSDLESRKRIDMIAEIQAASSRVPITWVKARLEKEKGVSQAEWKPGMAGTKLWFGLGVLGAEEESTSMPYIGGLIGEKDIYQGEEIGPTKESIQAEEKARRERLKAAGY